VNPQKIARVTGVLFVITFIASIPPVLFLYGPVLDDPRYIVGDGAEPNKTDLNERGEKTDELSLAKA